MTEQARRAARSATSAPLPAWAVGVLAVLGAMLGQLAVELGAGRVPVPPELVWTVPIAIAGLVTLVAYLPSPASGARGRADHDGS